MKEKLNVLQVALFAVNCDNSDEGVLAASNAINDFADQEKQALKDEFIKKVKESNLSGTEHAHPIGFNLGKEEGKKEGWNDCIKMIEEERNILQNTGSLMWHEPDEQKKTLQIAECLSITLKYITELQKLRK